MNRPTHFQNHPPWHNAELGTVILHRGADDGSSPPSPFSIAVAVSPLYAAAWSYNLACCLSNKLVHWLSHTTLNVSDWVRVSLKSLSPDKSTNRTCFSLSWIKVLVHLFMPAVSQVPTHQVPHPSILFVDDEASFLETVGDFFTLKSNGEIKIKLAQNVAQAIKIIEQEPVKVIIIDIHMPVVDGLQFMTLLHHKHPRIRKIILTGYATDTYRTTALKSGASLFLEKPRSIDEFESLYETITELMRQTTTDRGFSGLVHHTNLSDMLQMFCLSGSSLVLEVQSELCDGGIFIKNGTIVHVQSNDRIGFEAFFEIMSLMGGEFTVKPFLEPPTISITDSWEHLLLETARLTDEGKPPDQYEPPVLEPFAQVIPDLEASLASQSLPVTDSPHRLVNSEPNQVGSEVDDFPQDHRFADISVSPSSKPSETLEAPIISRWSPLSADWCTELVLTNPQSEVIEAHSSEDPNLRADLLDFLSMKTSQISQALNARELHHLELQGVTFSAVVLINPEIKVFALSTKPEVDCQGIIDKLPPVFPSQL